MLALAEMKERMMTKVAEERLLPMVAQPRAKPFFLGNQEDRYAPPAIQAYTLQVIIISV